MDDALIRFMLRRLRCARISRPKYYLGLVERERRHHFAEMSESSARLPRRTGRWPTADDLRRFQVWQQDDGVPVPTMNSTVSALRFFFTVTLDRPDLSRKLVRLRYPRKLPSVLSAEEVARLLGGAKASSIRPRWPLPMARACGSPRWSALKVGDIDSDAHADPRRARQGPQGSPRHAVAGAARPCCATGGGKAGGGA